MIERINIAGFDIIQYASSAFVCRNEAALSYCLIQMLRGEFEAVEDQLARLEALAPDKAFFFIGVEVPDPNEALSPWNALPVFGNEPFGAGAQKTLNSLLNEIIPQISQMNNFDCKIKYIIGGYSFSALFALWASYRSELFYGVAAASPSVWFPRWDEFISSNIIKARRVYLSLGKSEKKTRNKLMRSVEERIRLQYDVIVPALAAHCTLEWNDGNHFSDTVERKVKAYLWLMHEASY